VSYLELGLFGSVIDQIKRAVSRALLLMRLAAELGQHASPS
jgi:hypothetical protein